MTKSFISDEAIESMVKDKILAYPIQKLEEPKKVYFFLVYRPFLHKAEFVIFDDEKTALEVLENWKRKNEEIKEDPKKDYLLLHFYSFEIGSGEWNKPESFIKKMKVRDLLHLNEEQEILIVNNFNLR